MSPSPTKLARKLPRYPSVPAVLIGWLGRHVDFAGQGIGEALLFDAIKELAVPADRAIYIWLAGEANVLQAIRRHLVNERGVDRAVLNVNGHWKYQVANWDHHDPIDEDDA